MGARKLDEEGLDGRALAALADVLRVRRGSKVATEIIGDADIAQGEEATVRVAGTTEAPARKPRRKLKLVGKDGQVVREVDDVALVGALAVRAEIETARADGVTSVGLCQRCEKVPVVKPKRGYLPKYCPACKRDVERDQARTYQAQRPEKRREQRRASRSKNIEKDRARIRAYRARKRAEREAAQKAS